ncbi:MAG: PKD domain-containing protein [Bacteroidota bacterium]
MKHVIFVLLHFVILSVAYAQPANDSWKNAAPVDPTKCSSDAAYTTVNATDENIFGASDKWPANSPYRDVWFKFTAVGFDLDITVTGASTGGGTTGGTLQNPLVALYTISGPDNSLSFTSYIGSLTRGTAVTSYYKGALTVGDQYYIRVSAANNSVGTFKLCVNSYTAPLKAGQDLSTASILCDKRSFTESNVTGAGQNNRESAGSCLGTESNSVWYKWVAKTSGTLTMDITPTVNTDDIDWIIYDLGPGGNINNKSVLRCAVGHGVSNANCPRDPLYFKTGMNLTSTDIDELSGCGRGGQDGYVKAIDMVAGNTYALLVDNFSNGNNGFKIEFGGTGEFAGPTAKIGVTASQPCTINQNFTFSSAGSTGFTRVLWTFGNGASPATSTLASPPPVSYATPGSKTAVLQVFNEDGCSVGITETFMVGIKPGLPTISGLQPRYCVGETIVLNTPDLPDATYAWTGPDGFTSAQREINVPVTGSGKSGIYRLTITIFGCTSDPASVTIPPIGQTPTASFISAGSNLCTAQQTYRFTNQSTNFQNLRWNFGNGASVPVGSSGPAYNVTYTTSGTKQITLEAIGSNGCISTFTQQIEVTIRPDVPVIASNKPDFCLRDTIRLSTQVQSGVSFQWTGPNNFSSTEREVVIPVTSTLVAGAYSLVLTRGSCSTPPVRVVIPPIFKNPVAAFRADPAAPIKLSYPITIRFYNESTDGDSYLWDFGDSTTSTEVNPVHTYTRRGNFDVTLTVFKSNVCNASLVQGTYLIGEAGAIFIPNTFTPNNDAVNDEFVVNMNNIRTYRIQIFNRYGILMYSSQNLVENWNGTYNNEQVPVGTYYYVVDAVDFDGNVIQKSGSVTILR